MEENTRKSLQGTNIMPLVDDLRQIINQTRSRVASSVNSELTLMYWHIGVRKARKDSSWMLSSAGRASPLHGGGRGFEPLSIHHNAQNPILGG